MSRFFSKIKEYVDGRNCGKKVLRLLKNCLKIIDLDEYFFKKCVFHQELYTFPGFMHVLCRLGVGRAKKTLG